MPYEDSIQHLLVLFLQYKAARSPKERSRLELEILQLLDTLGASLSPEMLTVREDFERMRTISTPRPSAKKELRAEANDFFKKRIERFEFAPNGPALTWAAKEMLRVPIIEAYETYGYRNAEEADRSVSRIVNSMREEPNSSREGYGPLRNSLSVIRAYAENFCNIPPFCSGKRHE